MRAGQRAAFQPRTSNLAQWEVLGTVVQAPAIDPEGREHADLVAILWDDEDQPELVSVDELYPVQTEPAD